MPENRIPDHLLQRYQSDFVERMPSDIRQRFEVAGQPDSLTLRTLGLETGRALQFLTDGTGDGDPLMREIRAACMIDPDPELAGQWNRQSGLTGYVEVWASVNGYRDPAQFARDTVGSGPIQVEGLEQSLFDELQRAFGLTECSLNFARLAAADPVYSELTMPGISPAPEPTEEAE
ncbi:hypothetical protein ACFL3X_00815 [Gemmatimonadota bacterium]